MFARLSLALAFLSLFVATALAQQSTGQGETTCTFADGKQITVRYPQIPYDRKSEPPDGQPWPTDNTPIFLFTQSDVTIGQTIVPAGAYSVYTIPGKKDAWDLVITRDVKQDKKYDPAQDLGRIPMQTGTLSDRVTQLTAYFGHIAPKTCDLRLDYGRQRGYTDFAEK
jgi:hypothetical protein